MGLALLLVFALLFRPVRIVGESMLPKLADREIRLTIPTFLRQIRRHDRVVFREPDTGDLAVKRVAGLPGERVHLASGDLFIDGRRDQRTIESPWDLIPLLNLGAAEIAPAFGITDRQRDASGFYLLNGEGRLRRMPMDGFLLDGKLHRGERPAVDLGVAAFYQLTEDGFLELRIFEGAILHSLRLDRRGFLLQREGKVLAQAVVADVGEGWLMLAKVDQRLIALLGGKLLCQPVPVDPAPPVSIADGVSGPAFEQIGLAGAGVSLKRIRVGRDFFREATGTWAVREELQLTDKEYFLLGDHPSASRDSRFYGPVSKGRILGIVGPRLRAAPAHQP